MSHEDKSYVGMTACYFCGEAKDILLDRRMKDTLPRLAIYDMEPCEKCAELQTQGITLMRVWESWDGKGIPECKGWVVVKEEAVQRMFNEDTAAGVLKKRMAFVSEDTWEQLGLPTA